MLKDGLYEQIINREMGEQLSCTDKYVEKGKLDSAEAAKTLAKYVADVVEKSLSAMGDADDKLKDKIALTNRIIETVMAETQNQEIQSLSVLESAEQLLALLDPRNKILAIEENKKERKVPRPETSLAQSSLFTGATHEPQMYSELSKEIVSCDRIDMLVSFIKWTGLRLLMENLKEFTQNGGALRIITTSYMGATDLKAIEELSSLPNTQIKVSYDTKRTRLHAKAYVFHRNSGFTTAYVGSSNMSNVALSSGLEWNVKVTRRDLPETVDKVEATFESYWNSTDFEFYSNSESERERLSKALKAEKYSEHGSSEDYTLDVTPYSFQQEILDQLEAERIVRGHHRNLLVAATGTGKTVISALDYKCFRKQNPKKPCRLLFVAHREEILKQSLHTFRAVLKDANFGELFVGNYKPEDLQYLFMSIQTFNSQKFTDKTTPEFFDYIVVDDYEIIGLSQEAA